MKNFIKILILLQILILSSCSKNDEVLYDSIINAEELVGSWTPIGWHGGQVFHFSINGSVEYIGHASDNYDSIIEMIGSWKIEGDILTIVFRNYEDLTFVQKVIFKDQHTIKFTPTDDYSQPYFKGTYYRIQQLNLNN